MKALQGESIPIFLIKLTHYEFQFSHRYSQKTLSVACLHNPLILSGRLNGIFCSDLQFFMPFIFFMNFIVMCSPYSAVNSGIKFPVWFAQGV
jgi:hypothetical protein